MSNKLNWQPGFPVHFQYLTLQRLFWLNGHKCPQTYYKMLSIALPEEWRMYCHKLELTPWPMANKCNWQPGFPIHYQYLTSQRLFWLNGYKYPQTYYNILLKALPEVWRMYNHKLGPTPWPVPTNSTGSQVFPSIISTWPHKCSFG